MKNCVLIESKSKQILDKANKTVNYVCKSVIMSRNWRTIDFIFRRK